MNPERLASACEQGGAAIAFFLGSCGLIPWLDIHYRAVMALCAVGGLFISGAGFLVGCYYKSKHKGHEE